MTGSNEEQSVLTEKSTGSSVNSLVFDEPTSKGSVSSRRRTMAKISAEDVDADTHMLGAKALYSQPPTPAEKDSEPSPYDKAKMDERPSSRQTTLQAPQQIPFLSEEIEGLVAVTTTEYERYERNKKLSVEKTYDTCIIPPMTTTFSAKPPPDGWISYIHPEGQRYFLKKTTPVSILTEEYICDKPVHERLEYYIKEIFNYISRNGVVLNPDSTYLVLEFRESGNCGYYFVDHEHKCLFWLDPFDFSWWLSKVNVRHTASHAGLEMRSHY